MNQKIEFVEKHIGSLEDFVRKNSKYYLESWQKQGIKFNFAAFIFETLWFAYRKMYATAIILLFINCIVNLYTVLIMLKGEFTIVGSIITIIIRIVVGFKANDLYLSKAKKVLEESQFEPEEKKCGTSLKGVAIIVFVAILFQVILDFYLDSPVFYK